MGEVTARETLICFLSLGPSTSAEKPKEAEGKEELKEVPFQLQMTYTDLDGAQAIRVITQSMPITRDRDMAEKCKQLNSTKI